MKKAVLILASMWMLSNLAQAEQYRVIGVMDGDTVRVLSRDRQQVKCRLHGVDAPEKNQPWGERSKQSLSDLVFQKLVDVEQVDQDQYGRSVCRIFVNGVDINKVQLQRGMAWWYRRYSKDAAYAQAENTAKQQRVGLWSEPNPTPPWNFRRTERTSRY
jgi:endonuclease YncB( thermonuclease family)